MFALPRFHTVGHCVVGLTFQVCALMRRVDPSFYDQEVSADVRCLVIGPVNISGPGPLLPHYISVGGASFLLNLQMVPDFGCYFAPFFNTIPAAHTRLSGRHENGVFGK